MAPLPGLDKGVFKDPTPPATDSVISPITIPNGTILVTTKTTNETIDNVNQIIDYISGDAGTFIPQSAINNLVSDLAAKEILSNKVVTVGTPGNDTNYTTEKAVRDALDLKEDSLGFTPEDSANKGAVSGYAGLDSSQLLLLANFPTGTALQVLRRNAANTALEFAAAGAEVLTWTDNHDADGNNLIKLGTLEFDANTTITRAGSNMNFDIASGSFGFKIVTTQFSVSDTKVNIHGNILDLDGGDIQFDNILVRIDQSGGNLEYNVDTGNSHVFKITNSAAFTLSPTLLNVHNKKIINVLDPTNAQDVVTKAFGDANYIGVGSLNDLSDVAITTPADNDLLEFDTTGNLWKNRQGVFTGITGLGIQTQDFNIDANNIIFANSEEIRWVNGNRRIFNDTSGFIFEVEVNDIFKFRINTSDSLTIDGSSLTLLDGQNIVGPGFIDFAESGSSRISGIATALGIKVDLDASDIFRIDVGGTPEFTFSDSQADFAGNNLVNAPHDHEDAAGGGQLTATLALDATGTKDSTTFLRGDDTWAVPPGGGGGIVSINGDTTAAQLIIGTTNLIVITQPVSGTTQIDIGSNVATSSDNLSFFDSTTSAQLAGIINDETGTGPLVFGTSPTIITPTIASFINATHNHESDIGGGQLNALSALNATGTKDSTTFLRGDNTWDVPVGVEISTWTVPHNAATNNLINLGTLEFNASTKISRSGANMQFDVVNGEYLFKINTNTRFSVSETKVNIHGTLLDLSGANIQFDSNLVRISQDGQNLKFDVDEDDSFIFNIFNGTEYTLSKAFFNVHTKKIIGVVDPTNPQDVVTKAFGDANYLGVGITSINSDVTAAQIIAVGTGLDINDAGATHTLSVTAGVHSEITGLGIQTQDLQFGSGHNIILANSVDIRWVNGNRRLFNDESGFIWEVEDGDKFTLKIDTNPEYTFNDTQADFAGNNLINAVVDPTVTGISGITGLGVQTQDLFMGSNNINIALNSSIIWDGTVSVTGSIGVITILGVTVINLGPLFGSYFFDASALKLNNHDLSLNTSQKISWVNSNRRIFNDSSGFIFEVETGDFFKYQINSEDEYIFNSTQFIISDANDIVLGTTTGTKIATDAAQKLGFWGATPIVQPAHIVDANGTLADLTTKYNALLAQLAAMGLQASV